MKLSLLLLVALLAPLSASATTCVVVPFEEQLDAAQIVFVATVTGATTSVSFATAANGSDFRVDYTYEVRERIKGNPAFVTSLFTNNTYHAYDSDVTIQGDETRVLPGDTVLVIAAAPGDAQIASCTPSRIWHPSPDQLKFLRSRAPSNNAFKPNALRYTNNMADKACHVVAFATHVGLT